MFIHCLASRTSSLLSREMRTPRWVLFVCPAIVLLTVIYATSGPADDYYAVKSVSFLPGTTQSSGSSIGDDRVEPVVRTEPPAPGSMTTNGGKSRALYHDDPPLEPRVSRCMDVPGFTPVDGSPSRSPLNVADYLLRETKGKTLTEIGSRNGDILACITHFKVNEEKLPAPVSVELDEEYCGKMRARGIEVRCDPIEDLGDDKLPISDYYFWWPMAAKSQNTAWLRHIGGVLQKKGIAKGKTAIIACDPQWAEDRDNSYELKDWMGAEWRGKVFYDEGDHDRQFGGFRMIHVPLDFQFPTEAEVTEGKKKVEEKRREATKRTEEEERQRKREEYRKARPQ